MGRPFPWYIRLLWYLAPRRMMRRYIRVSFKEAAAREGLHWREFLRRRYLEDD